MSNFISTPTIYFFVFLKFFAIIIVVKNKNIFFVNLYFLFFLFFSFLLGLGCQPQWADSPPWMGWASTPHGLEAQKGVAGLPAIMGWKPKGFWTGLPVLTGWKPKSLKTWAGHEARPAYSASGRMQEQGRKWHPVCMQSRGRRWIGFFSNVAKRLPASTVG